LTLEPADFRRNRHLVGSKNFNLGKLFEIGVPIPRGFAITTTAVDMFLSANSLTKKILKIVGQRKVMDENQALDASLHIRSLIEKAHIPDSVRASTLQSYEKLRAMVGERRLCVSVRSSAGIEDMPSGVRAAGWYETFFATGAAKVLEALKRCIASMYRPTAILGRQKLAESGVIRGDPQAPSTVGFSVGVYELIGGRSAADLGKISSGVAVTKPLSGAQSTIVIGANWGLGTSMTEEENPNIDQYWVDKRDFHVERHKGKKIKAYVVATNDTLKVVRVPQKLRLRYCVTKDDAITIAQLAMRAENWFARDRMVSRSISSGCPLEIEWALKVARDSEIYFLQARELS